MRLLLDNLPISLIEQRDSIEKCLIVMAKAMPLSRIYLFGSHAHGNAHPESDVDLCVVTEEAEIQSEAAKRLREALWDVWPRPSFTLIPITPERMEEKKSKGDHFFQNIISKGVQIAEED